MTNVLSNPGFEMNSTTGWQQRNFVVTSSDRHSGTYAALKRAMSGSEVEIAGWLRQEFSAIPADQIREISFWYKGGDPANTTFNILYDDGSLDYFDLQFSSGWIRFAVSPRAGKRVNGVELDTASESRDILADDFVVDRLESGESPPPPSTYTLEILQPQPAEGGTTSPPPGMYSYSAGSTVRVSASAWSPYTFAYWLLDGRNVGSQNPITVTMDASHRLQAVFTSPQAPPPPPPPTTETGELKGRVYGQLGFPAKGATVNAGGKIVKVLSDGTYSMLLAIGQYDCVAQRVGASYKAAEVKRDVVAVLDFRLAVGAKPARARYVERGEQRLFSDRYPA